ncbi:MAG: hypothetical protein V9E90_09555 [Saprospiraceae bacterium]|jgi:hypothetical protein
MKKLIIYFILLISTKSLYGQFNLKFTVGSNLSNYDLRMISPSFKDAYQKYYKYRFLYNGGLGVEYITKSNISILSGLIISYRGSKDYAYPPPFRDYILSEYTFLELPILVSYSIKSKLVSIGTGVNLNKRLGSNGIRYGEYNRPYGLDLKCFINYNFYKRLEAQLSYTFGNYDKMLFGHQDVYLHHVFAVNIQYTFWRF